MPRCFHQDVKFGLTEQEPCLSHSGLRASHGLQCPLAPVWNKGLHCGVPSQSKEINVFSNLSFYLCPLLGIFSIGYLVGKLASRYS